MPRYAAPLGLLLLLQLAGTPQAGALTASIATNRTQGVAPLYVHFDATGSTQSGVQANRIFHDLLFEWDFGDAAANNEFWTYGARRGTLDKNHDHGPIAAHVYERPGTYVVKLKATDGGGNTGTTQVTINVSDPNVVFAGTRTVCVAGTAPSNWENAGCPSGAAHVVSGDFDAAIAQHAGANKRVLFRRGNNFVASGTVSPSGTTGIIGAFGPTNQALPFIRFTNGGRTSFHISAPDWRLMDLELQGPGGRGSHIIEATSRVTDFLVLRTRARQGTYHVGFMMADSHLNLKGQSLHESIGIVENQWQKFGFGSGGYFVYLAARKFAILGNRFYDITKGEHNIRIPQGEEFLVSHNEIGYSADSKAILNVRSADMSQRCSAGCGTPSHKFVISDNWFWASDDWMVSFTSKQNGGDLVPKGEDALVEYNFWVKGNHSWQPQVALYVQNTDRVTVRNNVFVMNDWLGHTGIRFAVGDASPAMNAVASNNTCYVPNESQWEVACVDVSQGSAGTSKVYNTLLFAPLASRKQVVRSEGNLSASAGNLLAPSNPFTGADPREPMGLQLRPSVQAVNAGSSGASVLRDFLRRVRPAGSGPDTGAFELGATNSEPTDLPPPPPPLLLP